MSRRAAPCGEVMMPIRCGNGGIGFFRDASNNPSACNRALSCSKANCRRARALRLHELRGDLQLAAIFINGDAPAHRNVQPVLRTKPQQLRRRPKHHHPNLRRFFLQREIQMPRIRDAQIRNFAFHPAIGILALNESRALPRPERAPSKYAAREGETGSRVGRAFP